MKKILVPILFFVYFIVVFFLQMAIMSRWTFVFFSDLSLIDEIATYVFAALAYIVLPLVIAAHLTSKYTKGIRALFSREQKVLVLIVSNPKVFDTYKVVVAKTHDDGYVLVVPSRYCTTVQTAKLERRYYKVCDQVKTDAACLDNLTYALSDGSRIAHIIPLVRTI